MSNKNRNTHLVFVVDRSGSMANIASDMSGGVAHLLEEQKKLPGNLKVTLAQFDTEYELVWDAVPVKDVGDYTLTPRGGTALLDGLGKTLGHVDTVVGYHEDDIVIVAVITDGEENSSREWKLEDVRSRVEKLTEAGWHFTFLGADIDSFAAGSSLGFAQQSTINFAHTAGGTQNTYKVMSNHVSSLRGGQSLGIAYSGAERKHTMEEDDEA